MRWVASSALCGGPALPRVASQAQKTVRHVRFSCASPHWRPRRPCDVCPRACMPRGLPAARCRRPCPCFGSRPRLHVCMHACVPTGVRRGVLPGDPAVLQCNAGKGGVQTTHCKLPTCIPMHAGTLNGPSLAAQSGGRCGSWLHAGASACKAVKMSPVLCARARKAQLLTRTVPVTEHVCQRSQGRNFCGSWWLPKYMPN